MAKPIPYPFVLDELESLGYRTNPMFGATAVYVGEKIVMCLWEKPGRTEDSGVWLATTPEHHESLKKELPSMRSIAVFGPGPTGWQVIPAEAPDFEDSVYRVCALIRKGDPRIGKIPAKKKKKSAAATATKTAGSRPVSDDKRLPHPGSKKTRAAKKRPAAKSR